MVNVLKEKGLLVNLLNGRHMNLPNDTRSLWNIVLDLREAIYIIVYCDVDLAICILLLDLSVSVKIL